MCVYFLTGIYLTISMALTSISVILTVCVLKLHHCGPYQLEVPPWMRWLVLKCLARFVRCACLKSFSKRRKVLADNIKRSNKSKHAKKPKGLSLENREVCLRLVNQSERQSPVMEFRSFRSHNKNFVSNNGGLVNDVKDAETASSANTDKRESLHSQESGTWASDARRLAMMEEILRYLKVIVAKRDEDDEETEVVKEWQMVASVMDRCLFLLFLSTTTIATLVIMVFIPIFVEH